MLENSKPLGSTTPFLNLNTQDSAATRFLERIARSLSNEITASILQREMALTPNLSWKIKNRAELAASLIVQLSEIFTSPDLRTQLVSIEQRGILPAHELSIEGILRNKRLARPQLRALLTKAGISNQNECDILLSAELIPLIVRCLRSSAVQLGSRDESSKLSPARALLRSLKISFLDNNPQLRKALANVLDPEMLPSISDQLQRIAELPRPPLEARQSKLRDDFLERIQCALVKPLLLTGTVSTAQHRLVDLWSGILKRSDIELHLYHENNLDEVMKRLLNACERGSISLCTISCPNYSGEVEKNSGGTRLWKYDFRELKDGIGVVTYKGLPHIKAWAEELHAIGVRATVVHLLPSFEVADGFRASLPEHSLTREQALERLNATNSKVQQLYQSQGVEIQTKLSDELIPDHEFANQRARMSEQLQALREIEPHFRRMVELIYSGRMPLYQSWYPARDESPEIYRERIENEVITSQLAEQLVIAQAVTLQEDTLLLACDSTWMSEILGVWEIPALFGQGKGAIGYVGD